MYVSKLGSVPNYMDAFCWLTRSMTPTNQHTQHKSVGGWGPSTAFSPQGESTLCGCWAFTLRDASDASPNGFFKFVRVC